MKKEIMALLVLGVLSFATACGNKNGSNTAVNTEQKESAAEANTNSNKNLKNVNSLLKGSSAEEYFNKICEVGKMEKFNTKKPDDVEGNTIYYYSADGSDYSKGTVGNRISLISNEKDEITFIQLNSSLSEESLLRAVFSELDFEGKDDAFMDAADKYVNDIVSNGKAVDGEYTSIGNIKCQVILNEDEKQSLVMSVFASGD